VGSVSLGVALVNTRPIQFSTANLLFLFSVTAFSTVFRVQVLALFVALSQFDSVLLSQFESVLLSQFESVLLSHSYHLTLLQSQVSGRGWLNGVTVAPLFPT